MTHNLLRFEGIAALPSDFVLNGRTPHRDLWGECISKVLEFRDLQEDWDGLGADAPFEWAIRGAIELAEKLQRQGMQAPARVVPGITGTVLFEWQNDGLLVEMEVTSESSADMLVMRDGQPPLNGAASW